ELNELAQLRKENPQIDKHLAQLFWLVLMLDLVALAVKTVHVLEVPRRSDAGESDADREQELAASDQRRAEALRDQAQSERIIRIDIAADEEIAKAASDKRVAE